MPVVIGTVTRKGKALLAKLQTGTPLEITRVMTGSGHVPEEELPEQVAVSHPEQRMNKSDYFVYEDGHAKLPVQVRNTGLKHAYSFWQIGLYATDPDEGEILYILYQARDETVDQMLPESVAPNQGFNINLHVVFDSTSGITVKVDPKDYVTYEALIHHNEAPDAHINIWERISPDTELVRIDHNLNCYPPYIFLTHLRYGAGIGPAGVKPAGGTDSEALPTRAVYHDRNSLTVKTIKAIAEIGVNPTVERLSPTEFIVTFNDNDKDSLYVQLVILKIEQNVEQVVSINNMVFSHQPPEDTNAIWGEIKE